MKARSLGVILLSIGGALVGSAPGAVYMMLSIAMAPPPEAQRAGYAEEHLAELLFGGGMMAVGAGIGALFAPFAGLVAWDTLDWAIQSFEGPGRGPPPSPDGPSHG